MDIINKVLWIVAISLILINSFYLSIKLRLPQLKITDAINYLRKKTKGNKISPKDTLIMTLSSKIGVGSLSGIAICLHYGGVGSIFWVYMSTFVLAIINYIENALAIIYKDKNTKKSGPSYYIEKGLNKKNLGIIYALLILISYNFLFSPIQTNSITTLSSELVHTNKVLISVLVTLLSGFIILKGVKSISNICNKIFPFMTIIFISTGIFVICKQIDIIPSIIINIIKEAFNTKAISGGILYTIIIAFQRSVFASEAGVGTSAIMSGSTDSTDYKLQAKMGVITTYFINFIILGITSIIIMTADIKNLKVVNGIELTRAAFSYHLGMFGDILLLIIVVLFSFSSIITIYYYGESSLNFITKRKKFLKLLKPLTITFIFVGGVIKATIIWRFIDIFLALLTIINMYAILKLRKKIIHKLGKSDTIKKKR